MGSFFTFTDVALRASQDDAGKPWPHMALKVRRHENGRFRVQGDHPEDLGDWYEKAAGAVQAIRRFCKASRYTASIMVYTPDNRHIWCVVQIVRPT